MALTWLLLSQLAVAADRCPWDEIESVSSTMTSVTINGDFRSVRGHANWTSLAEELRDCDMSGAAAALTAWRGQRRATNWTAGMGLVLIYPALLATPFTAVAAGEHRMRMEGEIRRGPREPRPAAVAQAPVPPPPAAQPATMMQQVVIVVPAAGAPAQVVPLVVPATPTPTP